MKIHIDTDGVYMQFEDNRNTYYLKHEEYAHLTAEVRRLNDEWEDASHLAVDQSGSLSPTNE